MPIANRRAVECVRNVSDSVTQLQSAIAPESTDLMDPIHKSLNFETVEELKRFRAVLEFLPILTEMIMTNSVDPISYDQEVNPKGQMVLRDGARESLTEASFRNHYIQLCASIEYMKQFSSNLKEKYPVAESDASLAVFITAAQNIIDVLSELHLNINASQPKLRKTPLAPLYHSQLTMQLTKGDVVQGIASLFQANPAFFGNGPRILDDEAACAPREPEKYLLRVNYEPAYAPQAAAAAPDESDCEEWQVITEGDVKGYQPGH